MNKKLILISSLFLLSLPFLIKPQIVTADPLPRFGGGSGDPYSCTAEACTSCNQRCNATGNGLIEDRTCASLCPYVVDQFEAVQEADFYINGTGVLYGGSLGIGTAEPAVKLEISDTNNTSATTQIRVTDQNNNPEIQLQFSSGVNDHWSFYVDQTNDDLRFWGNGSNRIIFYTDGRIITLGQLCLPNDTSCLSAWSDINSYVNFPTYTASNGIYKSGNNFSLSTTCSVDQVLKYSGSDWSCADDAGGTAYTAGSDLYLSDGKFNLDSQLDYVNTISRSGSNLTLQTLTSGNIFINPAGYLQIGDKIGIGIAPSYPLEISEIDGIVAINLNDSDKKTLNWTGTRLARENSETWFIGMGDSNDNLLIRRNGTDNELVINSSTGKVGINTASPNYDLDVSGYINASSNLCINGDCRSAWTGSSEWTDQGVYLEANNNSNIKVYDSSGLNQLYVDSLARVNHLWVTTSQSPIGYGDDGDAFFAGNVGIGNGSLVLASSENLVYGNIDSTSSSGSNLLLLQKEGLDMFKVRSDGQITIGDSTKNWGSGTNAAYILAGDSTSATANLFRVMTGTSNRFIVKGDGSLCINDDCIASWDEAGSAQTYTSNNGIILSGSNFQLGGSLNQDTTFTYGNFDTVYNLTGVGDFEIQDGGNTSFMVDSDGNTTVSTEGVAGSYFPADTLSVYGNVDIKRQYVSPYTLGRGSLDVDGNITSLYGNIGIRESSPDYPLDVADDDSVAIVNIDNIGADLWTGTRLARDGSEKWFIGIDNASDNLLFRRGNSTNDMYIDTSGNVDINNKLATGNSDLTLTSGQSLIEGWVNDDSNINSYILRLRAGSSGSNKFYVSGQGYVFSSNGISAEVILPENKIYNDDIYKCNSWEYNGTNYICNYPQVQFGNYSGGFQYVIKEIGGYEPDNYLSRKQFCKAFAMDDVGGSNGNTCGVAGTCTMYNNDLWSSYQNGAWVYWDEIYCTPF